MLFTEPLARKELRPYQRKGLDMVFESLGKGNPSVIMQASVGAGKTLMAANLTNHFLGQGKKVMFTVPLIALVDQTIESFEAEGITDIGVMQGNHPRKDDNAQVQIASLQTLRKRQIPNVDVVIVDEAHLRHTVMDKMMEEAGDTKFIGLSATPWATGLGKLWKDLVIPCTVSELIDQGYLCKFHVLAPDNPNMDNVKTSMGDYREADSAKVMSKARIVANVVETWLSRAENRPTLMFGVNRDHAKRICVEFMKYGVSAEYCDAMTDRLQRKSIERRFRSGEVKVVCSVRTLTTGVDWPVACIIDAAPTKSQMLHMQKIGRGLRVNPPWEDCLILDHAGNSFRLGLVTDIHYDKLCDGTKNVTERRKEIKVREPKECVKCGVLHTGMICTACGHEKKPPNRVEVIQGKLVPLTSMPAIHNDEKKRFWGMALWIDRDRRKDRKLAFALFKQKFNCWPDNEVQKAEIITPDAAFMNWEKARRIAYAKAMQAKGR